MSADVATAAPIYPERATDVAHAWVRKAVYDELLLEADRRRTHPDALAALILTAALLLGRVDELIEDAETTLKS